MTTYDYIVIAAYLVFMFALGPIYKSFSKTSSDFFRGGGGMLWWVVGSSAFMTTFTAWAFTGGAAKAYETGTFFLVIFVCNILSLAFCYFFVVAKYRQMRIITVMEGVRRRFGKTSEQWLTWLLVLVKTLYGGMMLYAIAVFMSSVFDVPMKQMIVVLGTIVTLMTVVGGSWSATAGDFVQMIVVVIITVTMSILTLFKAGGVSGVLDPARHVGEERVGGVEHDVGERAAAPAPELARRLVPHETQLGDGREDTFARAFAHQLRPVQDVGDGAQ